MDANNTVPQTPATPQVPAPVSVPPASSGDSNKIIMIFGAGLIIVILAVAGIYLFLSRQQEAENTQQPIVQVTPKPADMVSALDKDLNDVSIATADGDFTSIDQDLNQL